MNRFQRNRGYKHGDHWVIDDRTGDKIPASETRKEWTGAVVHQDDYEERHPQDFVRGRQDRQSVKDPRPPPVDTFRGPLVTEVTAAAAAGDTDVTVLDATGFSSDDRVAVMLADNNRHLGTLLSVPDGVTIRFTTGLPGAVAIGAVVINHTAVSPADLG